jgi:photosystem II stability/assembly factor-like uncharacterized protein
MKKLYILLLALFAMNGAMAQWFPQNSGTTSNLNSVYFTDADRGYAVGNNGTIIKTINGGTDWTSQTPGTTNHLLDVFFLNAATGYIVGDSGTILKTTNGGSEWYNTGSVAFGSIQSVSFVNSNVGYVSCSNSPNDILKTTDGGLTWIPVYQSLGGENFSISFSNPDTGYFVHAIWAQNSSANVFKTTDGGSTWSNYPIPSGAVGIRDAFFTDQNTGYAIGSSAWYSVILKTIDGGENWSTEYIGGGGYLKSIYFPNPNIGYSVGRMGNIVKTNDSGETWKNQISGTNNHLISVFFSDENTGYATGNSGTVLKTTNGGGMPGCLPEGIAFNTQEQIDNFQANYPGCTEIEGDVTIEGWNITNLNGLSVLTSIGGYLKIRYNSSLTSLTGLDNLTSIGGGLQIGDYDYGNHALTSLSGLDNLISIGGNMFIGYNPELTDLTGLESVTSLQGDLTITGNNSLTNCAIQNICNYLNAPNGVVEIYNNGSGCNSQSEVVNACGGSVPCLPYGHYYLLSQADVDNFQENFPVCNDLAGNLTITGNSIVNLTGLNQVYSIGGSVSINYCDNLENLNGLENLYTIGGSFSLHDNHRIKDFSGLENLDSIGALVIGWTDDGGSGGPIPGGNDSLVSLSSLSSLTYVRGIEIGQNPSLISLAGLDNINANTLAYVAIGLNSSLSTCEVQSICAYLAAPNAYIAISDNAPGCNSPEEVEAACEQHCLPEGITFTSQEQIDNFQTNYPGCTEIEGTVNIGDWMSGSNITNLNGLSVLTSVGGGLNIGNNPALTSLIGLDNLNTIGGDFWIYWNQALTSLLGLDNVSSIGGLLGIDGNDALTNLEGLDHVSSIGGDLRINDNSSLSNLTGIENLASIGGDLSITDTELTDLSGLNNLVSLGGDIIIGGNYSLTSLTGLEGLTSVTGSIILYIFGDNWYIGNSLQNLTGLDNITSIGGDLDIRANFSLINLTGLNSLISANNLIIGRGKSHWWAGTSLVNLNGLENLTTITGELFIDNSSHFSSLEGIENLNSIEGNMTISNSGLSDFSVSSSLSTIGDNFVIKDNSGLTSLAGLNNLSSIGGDLTIAGNPLLSECDASYLCIYLSNPNGSVNISNNYTGCNSPDEVKAACTFSVEPIGLDNEISIFPNPADKTLSISVENGTTIQEVLIYNQTGQKVLQCKPVNNTLDISKFRPGMYIVEMVTKQGKVREKLMVE